MMYIAIVMEDIDAPQARISPTVQRSLVQSPRSRYGRASSVVTPDPFLTSSAGSEKAAFPSWRYPWRSQGQLAGRMFRLVDAIVRPWRLLESGTTSGTAAGRRWWWNEGSEEIKGRQNKTQSHVNIMAESIRSLLSVPFRARNRQIGDALRKASVALSGGDWSTSERKRGAAGTQCIVPLPIDGTAGPLG